MGKPGLDKEGLGLNAKAYIRYIGNQTRNRMYILSQEELQEDINTLKELDLKYKLHEVQALKIGDLETYNTLQGLILGLLTAEVKLGDLLITRKRSELEFIRKVCKR